MITKNKFGGPEFHFAAGCLLPIFNRIRNSAPGIAGHFSLSNSCGCLSFVCGPKIGLVCRSKANVNNLMSCTPVNLGCGRRCSWHKGSKQRQGKNGCKVSFRLLHFVILSRAPEQHAASGHRQRWQGHLPVVDRCKCGLTFVNLHPEVTRKECVHILQQIVVRLIE